MNGLYKIYFTGEYDWTAKESPFLYLTCELPPPPLFRDEHYNNIIPQVSLFTILNKFNGETEKEYKTYKDNLIRKFELTKLPPYIILYIKRFTKNTFFLEKNPTIVNFPVKGIDFGDFLAEDAKEKHKDVNTSYDLIANVVHEGLPTSGIYKVHVLHKGKSQKPTSLTLKKINKNKSSFQSTAFFGRFSISDSFLHIELT